MDDLDVKTPAKIDASHPFTSVPIEISVCVGKARPLVRELISLEEEGVLRLDKTVEDPVELYVGEKLIALGRLEEQEGSNEGQLLVRITEILDLQTQG